MQKFFESWLPQFTPPPPPMQLEVPFSIIANLLICMGACEIQHSLKGFVLTNELPVTFCDYDILINWGNKTLLSKVLAF